ncbi:MAG: hypothetical protein DMG78_31120 [Acidobacteria bacterium]|nr:MAG: hypothetical protein DMG78_31120 [Acidobacteriota bacterium]
MSVPLPIVLAVFLVALVAAALHLLRRRTHAKCSNCSSASQFGYSREAESASADIARLCLACLMAKLSEDYRGYAARALVIEPAGNLPCYVFQPKSKWEGSKLVEDLKTLLANMKDTCRTCGSRANFLWVISNGLLPSTFARVFSEGPSLTLLRWGNDQPFSVCGPCCLALIKKTIENHNLTFLEVCGPRSEDGAVIPMGY